MLEMRLYNWAIVIKRFAKTKNFACYEQDRFARNTIAVGRRFASFRRNAFYLRETLEFRHVLNLSCTATHSNVRRLPRKYHAINAIHISIKSDKDSTTFATSSHAHGHTLTYTLIADENCPEIDCGDVLRGFDNSFRQHG